MNVEQTHADSVAARDVWDIFGDFGLVEGTATVSDGVLSIESNGLRVETREAAGVASVVHRRTVVRNVSERPLAATCLMDVFRFGGGAFEVYTQANTWMNESRGAWQPLHTAVEARCGGMRTSYGAAPVLALWNRQTGRGRVFHLMSDASWEMRASFVPGAKHGAEEAVVEVGMDSRHLSLTLAPGEEIALPEILTYEFKNKTDLDCHKLHEWWHANHPSRGMPSIYNTWLCRFDKLDFNFLSKQVERARSLGLEYFVVDAGWFGIAEDWTAARGDWKEFPGGWLGGRLGDLAGAVREAGMKFGLWIEAENASAKSEVVHAHPGYFRHLDGEYYLDFTRDDAREYLLGAVDSLVADYGVEFIKFDYNCDPRVDPSGRDFADYNAGYRRFLREVRARHPGIYLEGCASGGLMMDLGWARDFDSFWLSDNQNPVHGLRIAKETMLRMAPRMIDRWITVQSAEGLQPDYNGRDARLIATEDAGWWRMRTVSPEYVAAFAAGGVIGFSCDLTAISETHADCFRKLVADRKRDETFWCGAVGRILCDTPEVVALQYSDAALKDVRVFVATGDVRQCEVEVRPVLNPALEYEHDGRRQSGAQWMADGVTAETADFTMKEFRFSTP